ncbi:aminotransferase class I/II-fold pyridoxal phosphate-dependent enzyme [bacterium]|nr:aminotransferase class I/II-fold pyridoxal phosphate-dependent enzyme [bacterium]
MTKLAERTTRIDSSGIRKVFALAADLENPVNLSIGQPHFDIPDEIKQAGIEAIQAGQNAYTQTAGLPALREKVRDYYKKKGIEQEEIMITSGVSGAILLSLLSVLDEGDEIIVPDPYFVMYKHLANFIHAKPVYLDTYPDFRLDPDKIEAAITPKTKILIVNSPNNPTGLVYSAEAIKAIAAVAEKHGLLIITDEIYECMCYDQEPVSPAAYYPNTLVISGFSKSAAMTGWRLGYAYGPKAIIDAMMNIQMYSFVCAPSFAQHAGLAAMDFDTRGVTEQYKGKRDRIYEGLQSHFNVAKPGGAFYIFPEAPNGDGEAFVKKAIENNLLIVPGNAFSEKNTHFRISFAAEDETIDQGIEILRKLAEEFS